jgi:hypothetical protein
MVHVSQKYVKLLVTLVFIGLLALPIQHTIRNHPNQYIYFNEFSGGLSASYGDYEMDYYFNSLKESADWFRKEILPVLPKDKKTIVTTQAADIIKYYFRNDTNIKIVYSRYYEKYSRDWDYAIFGNVYISPHQLKNQLYLTIEICYAFQWHIDTEGIFFDNTLHQCDQRTPIQTYLFHYIPAHPSKPCI